jgi:hypothetical protein
MGCWEIKVLMLIASSTGTSGFRTKNLFLELGAVVQEILPGEFSTTIMLGNKAAFALKDPAIVLGLST